ncbi:MAG: TRAP transporter TatT component family protein [Arenimonas sp.]|uniref:TRAP transporter TatT component family protein n=1 Tax=Arenimonas sp. TaxID=1872635 RepID=UPI0025BEAF0F|nr:TRAP transporter TatT component family protein [Arenimonas sp.]MBW8368277.1 TRAP transporter TatT component family protein [Arenimonas sp.]
MSMTHARPRWLPGLAALLALMLAAGCASLVGKASDRFAAQLGSAVTNSNDPATVRDGLPAYLLLIDGLVQGQVPGDKRNASLLFAAAELNGAYAGNFTGDDRDRAKRLAAKALDYARRGTCAQDKALCAQLDADVDAFTTAVKAAPRQNIAGQYALAAAWVGFLQANSEDWNAIADLPKIEVLLGNVVATDAGHARGMPRVYLGVLNSLRPEALGGKPELGRSHFEAAIAMSQGRNLYAKTLMAEYYARLVFDQALHDRLLDEVLSADPAEPGFTLTNVLAQERAKALVASGKDYF